MFQYRFTSFLVILVDRLEPLKDCVKVHCDKVGELTLPGSDRVGSAKVIGSRVVVE